MWRRRRLMTIRQLAEKIGRHESALRRIEKGQARPHFTTIKSLAEALDVTPEELFDLDEEEGRPP